MNKKQPAQLNNLDDLLMSDQAPRKPVRVTISIDECVYEDLRKRCGGMSFSRAVEVILKRALDRGAA